jgi:hypothetical protein
MSCGKARDWLLQAERPALLEGAPADLAAHVRSCPNCRRLAGALEGFERRYRDELAGDTVPPRPRLHRRVPVWRYAVAAVVLLAVGTAVWVLVPGPSAHASADVVEQLLDWNLDLSTSRSPDTRGQVYAENAPKLEAAVAQADLPPEDQQLAVALLESGTWLASNDDPLAEVDRFNDLADQLLAQIDQATGKKDAWRIRKLARLYRQVAERGIQANLQRAEASGPKTTQKQRRLERLLQRDIKRAETLADLLQRVPKASRKEVRLALDQQRKTARPKKPNKQ